MFGECGGCYYFIGWKVVEQILYGVVGGMSYVGGYLD